MYEALILLELGAQILLVDVEAWLHAEELKVVDLMQQRGVLEVLAGVTGKLLMRMNTRGAQGTEKPRGRPGQEIISFCKKLQSYSH